jgi:hypothetical protein
LDREDFEVVIGAMEHSPELTGLCRDLSGRLDIVSVACAHEWQVGQARNLALQVARGTVVVLLDVDMVVPRHLLDNLWQAHFAGGGQVCVVGQMLDYDNNSSDVEVPEPKPYGHYEDLFETLARQGPGRADMRLRTAHVIPWAFAWTALLALPLAAVREHDLLFDLEFRGYGVEDLEWAYRVSRAGIPITVAEDVYGIHLPHARNVAANRGTEQANYRYFLSKWPSIEVELAATFGDYEANRRVVGLKRELCEAFGPAGGGPLVARGRCRGVDTVVVGGSQARDGGLELPAARMFDEQESPSLLPLLGMALPFTSQSVQRCVVLPTVRTLSSEYRDAVLAEARRVSRSITEVETSGLVSGHELVREVGRR